MAEIGKKSNIYIDNIGYILYYDIKGDIPGREQQCIKRFIKYYKDRLLEMWKSQNFELLPPIE